MQSTGSHTWCTFFTTSSSSSSFQFLLLHSCFIWPRARKIRVVNVNNNSLRYEYLVSWTEYANKRAREEKISQCLIINGDIKMYLCIMRTTKGLLCAFFKNNKKEAKTHYYFIIFLITIASCIIFLHYYFCFRSSSEPVSE